MYESRTRKSIIGGPSLSAMALLTLGLFPVSSLIGAGKLSVDLEGLPLTTNLDVIVQFVGPPTASDQAGIAQLGGQVKAQFHNIPDIVVSLPVAALTGISANPRVKYISPDRKLAGSLEFAEPTVGAGIALQYGWDGSG